MGMDAQYEERKIELSGRSLAYRVRRSSRRRTVTLTVAPEDGLVVHCPRRFARWRVEQAVRSKARWILARLEEALQRQRGRKSPRWLPGSLLPFRGGEYRLEVVRTAGGGKSVGPVRLEEGRLRLPLPAGKYGGGDISIAPGSEAEMREWMLQGYMAAAREMITARVAHFQAELSVQPCVIRIKGQKRRWGSCSAKGGLNFNWRLILAPPEVLDYVVVHELCHLLHMNHSRSFWERVARVLPEYKRQRDWLKEHGYELYIDDAPLAPQGQPGIPEFTDSSDGIKSPQPLPIHPPLQLELL